MVVPGKTSVVRVESAHASSGPRSQDERIVLVVKWVEKPLQLIFETVPSFASRECGVGKLNTLKLGFNYRSFCAVIFWRCLLAFMCLVDFAGARCC